VLHRHVRTPRRRVHHRRIVRHPHVPVLAAHHQVVARTAARLAIHAAGRLALQIAALANVDRAVDSNREGAWGATGSAPPSSGTVGSSLQPTKKTTSAAHTPVPAGRTLRYTTLVLSAMGVSVCGWRCLSPVGSSNSRGPAS